MNFLNNLSIKNKLILVILLVTIITTILGTITIIIINNKSNKEKLIDQSKLIAVLIAEQSVTSIDFNNKQELNAWLINLKALPNIIHCQIYNKENQLFAVYNKTNKVLPQQTIPTESNAFISGPNLFVFEPIIYQNIKLGTVLLNIDTQSLIAENQNFIKNMLIILVVLLVFAYLIAFRLQKLISKPIIELAKVTEQISNSGNYTILINRTTDDEIGLLYEKFSEMMNQIKIRDNEKNELVEALQDSQERFRKMNSSAFDALILIDENAQVIYWNRAAEHIFHYSYDEIFGKELHNYILPLRHRELFKTEIHNIVKEGASNYLNKPFEFVAIRKDLTEFPIDVSIVLLKIKGKYNFMGTIRDISERKRTHQELIEAKERAIESDRLKSAFLANMSHEIRTPMNAIIGFSELLANPKIFAEQREKFTQHIITSGKSLLALIDDILDISKIEAGQLTIDLQEVNLHPLLADLYLSFNETYKNRENKINFILSKDSQDDEFILITDIQRLKQILTNLITNAFKFTDEGEIEFGYKIMDNHEILFFVRDSGVGIPPEKINIIFDRFGQVQETRGRNTRGTGLGLAISKKLVELIGGKIWVESVMGEGSVFNFTIPYKTSSKSKKIGISKVSTDSSLKLTGKTILIAEDEDMNYLFISEVLSTTGVNILHAPDGESAIDMCKNNHIDLILMDIKMPGIDGYAATKMIKKFNPEIIIIAQTAYTMPCEKDRSLDAGCDDYIAKPIRIEILLNLVGKYLK